MSSPHHPVPEGVPSDERQFCLALDVDQVVFLARCVMTTRDGNYDWETPETQDQARQTEERLCGMLVDYADSEPSAGLALYNKFAVSKHSDLSWLARQLARRLYAHYPDAVIDGMIAANEEAPFMELLSNELEGSGAAYYDLTPSRSSASSKRSTGTSTSTSLLYHRS